MALDQNRLPVVKAELELLVFELKNTENTSFDVSRVTLEALLEIAVIAMRQQSTLTWLESGLDGIANSLSIQAADKTKRNKKRG